MVVVSMIDSHANSVGASPTSLGFIPKLKNNYGWSSSATPDLSAINLYGNGLQLGNRVPNYLYRPDQIPPITSGDVYVGLFGFNDMRFFGTSVEALIGFGWQLETAIAWMMIPDNFRYQAQTSAWTYYGTWTNVALYASAPQSKRSNVVGSSATIQVTGTTIYLGTTAYRINNVVDGRFKVLVDGVEVGSETICLGGMKESASPLEWGAQFTRIVGLTSGIHTVDVVVTKGTGSNYVLLDWIAGHNGSFGNKAYIGNCLQMITSAYTTSANSPFNNGSLSAVNLYNNLILSKIKQFRDDGLDVRYVDASRVVDLPTDITTDSIHMNNSGHYDVYNQFVSVIDGVTDGIPTISAITQIEGYSYRAIGNEFNPTSAINPIITIEGVSTNIISATNFQTDFTIPTNISNGLKSFIITNSYNQSATYYVDIQNNFIKPPNFTTSASDVGRVYPMLNFNQFWGKW